MWAMKNVMKAITSKARMKLLPANMWAMPSKARMKLLPTSRKVHADDAEGEFVKDNDAEGEFVEDTAPRPGQHEADQQAQPAMPCLTWKL